MQILSAAEHKPMPWKNGGGITFEVAVFPPEAGLDAFEWRVSMAQVESDGPFSRFPGVDRSLAVMQGDGLRLLVDGAPAALGPRSPPLVFSGDQSVEAALVGGPIVDLNVMSRRGVWRHRLVPERVSGSLAVVASVDAVLVVVRTGDLRCGHDRLRPRDTLLLAADERADLTAGAPAELFRIELARAAPHSLMMPPPL